MDDNRQDTEISALSIAFNDGMKIYSHIFRDPHPEYFKIHHNFSSSHSTSFW